VSRLEFQHVLVTNVQTINPPVSSTDDSEDAPSIEQVTGTQYVVTLALSPEQSERFVFATEFGKVWLSIQPSTVSDDGTRPVTLGNVYSVVR
jgi:pilus assembly protein CpaB